MSSIHTSIHQQPFGGTEEVLVRRLRRGLVALAVLAVGFLVFQGITAPDDVSKEGIEASPAVAAEQTFDGRGKWTGYAR